MPEKPADFTHLENMTDDTGLLEHAIGSLPRRGEGYTTDDNARALWVAAGWYHQLAQSAHPDRAQMKRLLRLADTYLAFLVWAQEPDGHFYNNFAYDRRKEAEQPSDDCLGRTLFSCAEACRLLPDKDRRYVLTELLQNGFCTADRLVHLRGIAYTLAAACSLMKMAETVPTEPAFATFIYKMMPELIDQFESKLKAHYRNHADQDWHWFASSITYSNGILPWALLKARLITGKSDTLRIAGEALDFLIEKMTAPEGHLRPVGNKGWCTRKSCAMWDQQPVDIMALALAAEEAAGAAAHPARYLDVIEKAHAWFLGENDGQRPMANLKTGAGYDGLLPDGVNRNQGAESTIAFLITELVYIRNLPDVKENKEVTGQTV
ncbi:glycosyltransferase [Sporolactobacillus sp. THM19-2]|uniref:glycosyltransferase n=1 Tax=Sporolactobacillus sp. THM19-2 TaxID=2511171 RepID=UPI00102066DB|nr:glycosyltransferase [Sporolactobacillus sp. THM19-2]RYL93721.1 glycosyltransferase [Sporolactobacillus sp. THM19-2]